MRYLLLSVFLVTPLYTSAMQNEKTLVSLLDDCVQSYGLKSIQKRLIVILTPEDIHDIVDLIDDELIATCKRSLFEKNILFLKYVIYVSAAKKGLYSPEAIRVRLAKSGHCLPEHRNLDELLRGGAGQSVSDTLTFYGQALNSGWNDTGHFAIGFLSPQDTGLMWVLQMISQLTPFLREEICCAFGGLCEALQFKASRDLCDRAYEYIKKKLYFSKLRKERFKVTEQRSILSQQLFGLLGVLSDEELKRCIYMLTRPFPEDPSVMVHLFFKMILQGKAKEVDLNDPILVDLLFEIIHGRLLSSMREVPTFLLKQPGFVTTSALKREKIDALLAAIKPFHELEMSPVAQKRLLKESSDDLNDKRRRLENLVELSDQDISAQLAELSSERTRLPELQKLVFHCVQGLRHENTVIPVLEASRLEQQKRAETLVKLREEKEREVALLRAQWQTLRSDLQKELDFLTDISKKTEI